MRVIFFVLVAVVTVFVLTKIPGPGARMTELPGSRLAVTAQPAAPAKPAPAPASATAASSPSAAAKSSAPVTEPLLPKYSTVKECVRSGIFGGMKCTQVTTLQR